MNAEVQGVNYPYNAALLSGQIKRQPGDFKVSEQLGFNFTGAGEHLYLYVQKTGLTTHQLVDLIATQVGVAARQIGYAGLKDKQAVTQQWLSIQLPGCKQSPVINETDQFKILKSDWHDKKLRTGAHKSNKFEIKVRDVEGSPDALTSVIRQIETAGFANYFGEQRFGSKQDNVRQALRVLNNRHKNKRLSRSKKSLYLSALRSELFNQILSERIEQDIWLQPLQGDVCMLAGSQSVFAEPINEQLSQRYQEFDIHCGISLYGIGESRLTEQALKLEQEIFSENSEICETLREHNIKRSFRANRAQCKSLQVDYDPQQAELHVQVELEKGCYLTTLLNHFVTI